jgi:hypothetical protein
MTGPVFLQFMLVARVVGGPSAAITENPATAATIIASLHTVLTGRLHTFSTLA